MFRYDTLREEWLIAVLFTGLALILYLILFYIDLGTPRKMRDGEPERNYLSVWHGIPWSVKVTVTVLLILIFIYLVSNILNPKSW
jgi:predicted small integral membrane protein